jgi:hypothetical protein
MFYLLKNMHTYRFRTETSLLFCTLQNVLTKVIFFLIIIKKIRMLTKPSVLISEVHAPAMLLFDVVGY